MSILCPPARKNVKLARKVKAFSLKRSITYQSLGIHRNLLVRRSLLVHHNHQGRQSRRRSLLCVRLRAASDFWELLLSFRTVFRQFRDTGRDKQSSSRRRA